MARHFREELTVGVAGVARREEKNRSSYAELCFFGWKELLLEHSNFGVVNLLQKETFRNIWNFFVAFARPFVPLAGEAMFFSVA